MIEDAANSGEVLADRLGIFARTFPRQNAVDVATAVHAAGYALAHWNFAALGEPTLATGVDESIVDEVRQAFVDVGIAIPSVSATFNIAHPDATIVAAGVRSACRLISLVPRLGATVVTICTGTRDPQHMWRSHPDNSSANSWAAMRAGLDPLLEAAAAAGVTIGVEPEAGNIVVDADAAARLLRELGSGAPVGVVLDPANLLDPNTVVRQRDVIAHALDLFADRIVGVQAKDVVVSGYSAAGAGMLDYPDLLAQLRGLAPVPVIVQDADEDDAARVRNDLLRWHTQAPAR